ncbi:MAG: hypothetical protein M1826_007063 [Phylliscum demangeonii]|nr:MAG: hypothetical protein M1826_007063 [Phylliscum demangeonii]
MYYVLYLSSLCHRRRWSEPRYELAQSASGYYSCTVRVNHREYQARRGRETEALAREDAAMTAYLICRNFSVNDGMCPAGHQPDGGVIQGLPVAIGTGRHSASDSASSGCGTGGGGGSGGGYASGGSSPRGSGGSGSGSGSGSDSGREEAPRAPHVSRLSRTLAYGLREPEPAPRLR